MVDYFTYLGPTRAAPLVAWINSIPWIHDMRVFHSAHLASLHLLILLGRMKDIAALSCACKGMRDVRNIWCEGCRRRTFSPRRTTFMGFWDMDWEPDHWWEPLSLLEHLDRGDGEGETMLCFVCWAMHNWSNHRSSERAFFAANDAYTDLDRGESERLLEFSPDWGNPLTIRDDRPSLHSQIVREREREDRRFRHPCFARRWSC